MALLINVEEMEFATKDVHNNSNKHSQFHQNAITICFYRVLE